MRDANWGGFTTPQCLKIIEKVVFNIASEASYVYLHLKCPKLVVNAKSEKFKRDILGNFQTMCTQLI